MLLTEMISDEEGHLAGRLEEGRQILLSVPHSYAIAGRARFQGPKDVAMEEAKMKLSLIARTDTGNYYYISEGCYQDEDSVFVIPYTMFIG